MRSDPLDLLDDCEGFEWDIDNTDKIWKKHKLSTQEIETAFFDQKVAVFEDIEHSQHENRYVILGKTAEQRLLFIAYTIRNKKIRPISARDAKKEKEVALYEKAT